MLTHECALASVTHLPSLIGQISKGQDFERIGKGGHFRLGTIVPGRQGGLRVLGLGVWGMGVVELEFPGVEEVG